MTTLHEKTEDTLVMLTYEMTEVVRKETKLKEAEATKMAEALLNGLRERLGGQRVYIPAADKIARDIDILNNFTGTAESLALMMKKHSLSKSAVYKIVRRKRYLLKRKGAQK